MGREWYFFRRILRGGIFGDGLVEGKKNCKEI